MTNLVQANLTDEQIDARIAGLGTAALIALGVYLGVEARLPGWPSMTTCRRWLDRIEALKRERDPLPRTRSYFFPEGPDELDDPAPAPVSRRPSPKQQQVLSALETAPEITLAYAVELIGGDIYTNEKLHVGALLANMVKRGMIERSRPGVFRLPTTEK